MDDSQQHIFDHLSQHEEKPPEELYSKILSEISMSSAKDWDSELKSLKDFSIAPPAALFEHIKNNTMSKEKGMVFYFRKYRAAAAIFILGLITAATLYQLRSKDQTANTIVLKKDIPAILPADSAISKTGNNNPLVHTTANKKNHPYKLPQSRKTKPETLEMSFIDNDLLTSLTECTHCNFASFFTGKKKLVLTIGPYSSVTVTKKMGDFMKTLYSTNRRNKPTVKAKRARKTLAKWKKTDADHFDSSKEKLALDPLDLTEYIIDNK
jgi:hypothetical protein